MSVSYRVRWDGDETRDCETVPLIVETGQILDVEDETQWRKYHGHCHVGVLECQNCHRPLYLQQQSYGRIVIPYTPGQIRRHLNQSDEHRALKDLIATAAERHGLNPLEEDRAQHGKRITDVTVTGGTKDVGWEIQLSHITPDSLRRRVNRAVADGLTPSWLAMSGSSVAAAIGDRAPTSTTMTRHALEYTALQDIPLTGVKRLSVTKCIGEDRVAAWHRGKRCDGWHARFGPLIVGNPTLSRMVEGTAFGQYVPVRWPRKMSQKDVMIWLTPADEKRLWEIEQRPADIAVDPDAPATEGSSRAIQTRHRAFGPEMPQQGPQRHLSLAPHVVAQPAFEEPIDWRVVDRLPKLWAPGHCSRCGVPFSYQPLAFSDFCVACAAAMEESEGTR